MDIRIIRRNRASVLRNKHQKMWLDYLEGQRANKTDVSMTLMAKNEKSRRTVNPMKKSLLIKIKEMKVPPSVKGDNNLLTHVSGVFTSDMIVRSRKLRPRSAITIQDKRQKTPPKKIFDDVEKIWMKRGRFRISDLYRGIKAEDTYYSKKKEKRGDDQTKKNENPDYDPSNMNKSIGRKRRRRRIRPKTQLTSNNRLTSRFLLNGTHMKVYVSTHHVSLKK